MGSEFNGIGESGGVIVGNWKMHGSLSQIQGFARELVPVIDQSKVDVLLALPFTLLAAAQQTALRIGSQSVSAHSEGAFTGQISAQMVYDAGGRFTLVGHSESRAHLPLTPALLAKQIDQALSCGLDVIFCVGESKEERDRGCAEEIVVDQIQSVLTRVMLPIQSRLFIAYEPIWAIGSGAIAEPKAVESVLTALRRQCTKLGIEHPKLLYGGSVTRDDVATLMGALELDGLLVGKASLDVAVFSALIAEYERVVRV